MEENKIFYDNVEYGDDTKKKGRRGLRSRGINCLNELRDRYGDLPKSTEVLQKVSIHPDSKTLERVNTSSRNNTVDEIKLEKKNIKQSSNFVNVVQKPFLYSTRSNNYSIDKDDIIEEAKEINPDDNVNVIINFVDLLFFFKRFNDLSIL